MNENPTNSTASTSKPSRSTSKSATTVALHPFTAKWEKRKKIGYAPGLRSGCTMALWPTGQKGTGIGVLFGGVTDEDTNEETLESVFHNDL